jgi:hypothetical protein
MIDFVRNASLFCNILLRRLKELRRSFAVWVFFSALISVGTYLVLVNPGDTALSTYLPLAIMILTPLVYSLCGYIEYRNPAPRRNRLPLGVRQFAANRASSPGRWNTVFVTRPMRYHWRSVTLSAGFVSVPIGSRILSVLSDESAFVGVGHWVIAEVGRDLTRGPAITELLRLEAEMDSPVIDTDQSRTTETAGSVETAILS